ncbi:MAG: Bax inhibitor-1/YccA family protein [Candidatus Bathyarchaeia archaeon]
MLPNSRFSNQTRIINTYVQKVYFWMFIGLIITSITAYFVSQDPNLYNVILGNDIVFYGLLIAQFLAIVTVSAFIRRIPDNLAEITFVLYCFLTGLTLSAIFLEFTISSIAYVVLITAAMFGFMSLYGYVTKTDLTSLGNIATMALFGIILALIVNLFLMNSALDTILSIIGVLVFSAFTAHDTQKIKSTLMDKDEDLIKKEILGALNLYLDFVNLFLDLLDLFGKRRSD